VTARADRLMEFLATEGYRPTLRPDGDIVFKHDGGVYAVRFDAKDDQYLAVAFPNFWQLETDAEVARAFRSANRVTVGIKAAKVLVLEEARQVWAAVELFAVGTEPVEAIFRRILSVLRAAVDRFAEEMRASEPFWDERIALARDQVTRFQHGN
jgi:hypothetical protein